jgi:prepilin-type N-terminal cleavage/methylation domain-containing protein
MNGGSKYPRSGFTLVELLVVISILGVLLALVAPAILSARTSAKKTQGMSNLRQLHGFMMAYCTDHDGRLPLGGGVIEGGRNALSWINRLLPYAGVPALAETSLNDWWGKPPPHPVFKDPGIDFPGEMERIRAATVDATWGFGYNVQPLLPENSLYLADWQAQPLDGVALGGVDQQSRRILFASAFDWHLNGGRENRAYHRYGKNKAIGIYFDGHAVTLTESEYDKAFLDP